jgi:hypothetical protein
LDAAEISLGPAGIALASCAAPLGMAATAPGTCAGPLAGAMAALGTYAIAVGRAMTPLARAAVPLGRGAAPLAGGIAAVARAVPPLAGEATPLTRGDFTVPGAITVRLGQLSSRIDIISARPLTSMSQPDHYTHVGRRWGVPLDGWAIASVSTGELEPHRDPQLAGQTGLLLLPDLRGQPRGQLPFL